MGHTLPSTAELHDVLAECLDAVGDVPGAAVAVWDGNDISDAAAGVLNVGTGVEATADSLFQIGSVTKVWTATLVLQLVEEGRLALDDAVVRHLPELRLADDDGRVQQVTVRHLLTHTSGIDGDVFNDCGPGDDCIERFVAACDSIGFNDEPGHRFSYCNTGYILLGRIVEHLRGTTWDTAVRDRIIEPLGLERTVSTADAALRHRTAFGHLVDPDGAPALAPFWTMGRATGPAGSMLSTSAGDLLAFAIAHLDSTALLRASTSEAMRIEQVAVPDGFLPGLTGWGLGWFLLDWGGTAAVGHDGSTIGQTAFLRLVPERRTGVAVLTNSDHGGGVAQQLLARCGEAWLGTAVPPPAMLPAEPAVVDVAPYAGVYERAGVCLDVRLDADGGALALTATPTGPLAGTLPPVGPAPLVATAPDRFLMPAPGRAGGCVSVSFVDVSDGVAGAVFLGGRLTPRSR